MLPLTEEEKHTRKTVTIGKCIIVTMLHLPIRDHCHLI